MPASLYNGTWSEHDGFIIPGIPAERVGGKPMAAVAGHGIPEGLVHPLRDQHGVAWLQAGPQELDDVRAVNVPERGDFTQEELPLPGIQAVVQPLDCHSRHTIQQSLVYLRTKKLTPTTSVLAKRTPKRTTMVRTKLSALRSASHWYCRRISQLGV